MKALVCLQDSFNYKFFGIFPDAQGQLTLQSMARSGRMSSLTPGPLVRSVLNTSSVQTLWLFLLPEEMMNKNGGTRVATRCTPL